MLEGPSCDPLLTLSTGFVTACIVVFLSWPLKVNVLEGFMYSFDERKRACTRRQRGRQREKRAPC